MLERLHWYWRRNVHVALTSLLLLARWEWSDRGAIPSILFLKLLVPPRMAFRAVRLPVFTVWLTERWPARRMLRPIRAFADPACTRPMARGKFFERFLRLLPFCNCNMGKSVTGEGLYDFRISGDYFV